jgi:hypothetical protein
LLRQIVDLAQHQLADRRRDLLDIEPKPEEEVVEVSGERGYTQVILRQPCADGCADCPHGPDLYHVRPEHCPDGEDSLHWSFLGRVFDESSDGARS